MTQDLITQADLEWWLSRAAELEWTFAKTYAETAPHHYVVENRTPGVTHEDMVRAARVIHTFGQPGKYYSLTKIYLVSPDGKYRWWTEDRHFTDTTLVNRATTELFYGIQNAQATISGIETPFDGVATWWDAEHPVADGEPDRVKQPSRWRSGHVPAAGAGHRLWHWARAGSRARRARALCRGRLQPGNAEPAAPQAPEGRGRVPHRHAGGSPLGHFHAWPV